MQNYTSYGEFDSLAQNLAKINPNQIQSSVRQRIINDFVYQIYGLMDGTNSPFWNRTISLTVSDDLERLTDYTVNGGVLTALSASAHTVTRSSGTWAAGTILDIVLVLRTTGALVAQYKARVTVAGATATYAVIGSVGGTETTYVSGTHCLYVSGMKKLSATSAGLGSNYVKEIIKVFDDQGVDILGVTGKERVFSTDRDAKLWGQRSADPLSASDVFVYHSGDTIYFFVGSTATALGTVQAEVIIKPTIFTDATKNNTLDCPPEENGALRDSVVAEYIKATGGQVPQDIAKGAAALQARVQAANADRVKAMEVKGRAD
jgi:hypothetical protein